MKKYCFITGIFLIFVVGGMIGCIGPKATDYFNGEYDVDENTVLKVSTLNGQIEINVWDGNNISLNAIKKSSFGQEELDNIEINVLESEKLVEIEAKYIGKRATTPSVDMNIKIPNYVIIDSVTTSNGAIQISGGKGDVKATSSNGAIIIDDVDGYISASTSNGRIEVEGTTGVKNLISSNSGIEVEILDFNEDISISTSNGGISVYINPVLDAFMDMTTSNGWISISDISLNLTISEEKHMAGELGVGGNMIDIHTSNGNIYLGRLEI
jgi:hypothetical protein